MSKPIHGLRGWWFVLVFLTVNVFAGLVFGWVGKDYVVSAISSGLDDSFSSLFVVGCRLFLLVFFAGLVAVSESVRRLRK